MAAQTLASEIPIAALSRSINIYATNLFEILEKNNGVIRMEKKETKKATINMELTTFKIPPSGEVLVLGKQCPIGPQAAKRMLDSVAPGQFELVQVEDDIIDAVFCKKYLFLRAEREPLVKSIIEEAKAIMGPDCMIKIKCEVTVTVKRGL